MCAFLVLPPRCLPGPFSTEVSDPLPSMGVFYRDVFVVTISSGLFRSSPEVGTTYTVRCIKIIKVLDSFDRVTLFPI